jgi:hypothetical protein
LLAKSLKNKRASGVQSWLSAAIIIMLRYRGINKRFEATSLRNRESAQTAATAQ